MAPAASSTLRRRPGIDHAERGMIVQERSGHAQDCSGGALRGEHDGGSICLADGDGTESFPGCSEAHRAVDLPPLLRGEALEAFMLDGEHQGSLKGAFIPIGGLTSGFPHQGSLGRGGPWGSVWPNNVEKTGVWSIGQPGFLVVAAEAEQVERTRRKTWSRAESEFLCPSRRLLLTARTARSRISRSCRATPKG